MTNEAAPVQDASARYSVDAEAQDVPLAYKRTEVDVIPADWELAEIGTLKPFVTSGSRGWARFYSATGAPFIRITNLSRGSIYLDLDGLRFVRLSPDASAEAARTMLRDGDLLISITADIGIIGFVDARVEKPAYMNQHIAMIRFDPATISSRFIAYFLATDRPQRLFLASMDVGAKAGLNLTTVRKIQVALPALPEQCAIAEALSYVDQLLRALEALIAKKLAIKQAAMQQLLTGRTRLPGFSGAWETKLLGEIGVFSKGCGIRRDDVVDDGLPCILYGELYTRYHNYLTAPISRISSDVARTACPIKGGDLLFAGSGETAEEIGTCAAYLGCEQAFAGGDMIVLSPFGQSSMYLGHLMNHPLVAAQKARFGQGYAVVHIKARNLAQVEIDLPQVEEQHAIATVLADMDAEIGALERRRDKTRAIKQGMMQQLLTGRVRLVESATAARAEVATKRSKPHSWAFHEAVVISTLASHFGSEWFPLGRKRYTKLSYLLHRHAERHVEGYLKKAAGPYNPKTRYGGPERIALENGYIREHKNGPYSGFVIAENIAHAESYFEMWYGPDAIQWLEQFRFKKNDELEVLTTVDMAAEELRASDKYVDVAGVKAVIRNNPEWKAKIDRPLFNDAHIAEAIEMSDNLFDSEDRGPRG